MPVMRDFRCDRCGSEGEVMFMSFPYPESAPCACGGTARLIWKSFGPKGRVGGDKGRYPYFDVALGRKVHSSKEREEIAKAKNLRIWGPDEHRRTLNTTPENPTENYTDKPEFIEAMEKAWADVQSGNVPLNPARQVAEPVTVVESKGE